MAVEVKEQSTQQKQQEQADIIKNEQDLSEKIIKGLDLSTGLVDEPKEENDQEPSSESSEETDQNEAEATEDESSQEGSPENEPDFKKKMQERFDEMTRKNKILEAELNRLKKHSPQASKDPDMDKLENMSVDELRNLKKQVLRAQRTSDPQKLDELFELEDKIIRAIETAPNRFQSSQIERFNAAVESSAGGIPNFDKVRDEIYSYANNIYAKSPSMQRSVDGQAEAWQLALDHFSALQKLTVDKSKTKELERRVNDLKKKTSLDVATQRGVQASGEEARAFEKAKAGNFDDKLNFLKKRINVNSLIDKSLLDSFAR